MARQQDFRRFERERPPVRRFIIACEGKGEQANFKAIREANRIRTLKIFIVQETRTDPLSVVNTAISKRREQQQRQDWTAEDEAWAVFDGDAHIQNNRANWEQALQLAETQNIRLAISNPNFELWYLLHFQDQNAPLSGIQAEQRLQVHTSEYVKPLCLYPRVKPVTPDAIRRAAGLTERHERNDLPFYENPSCGVGALVERLLAIRK